MTGKHRRRRGVTRGRVASAAVAALAVVVASTVLEAPEEGPTPIPAPVAAVRPSEAWLSVAQMVPVAQSAELPQPSPQDVVKRKPKRVDQHKPPRRNIITAHKAGGGPS